MISEIYIAHGTCSHPQLPSGKLALFCYLLKKNLLPRFSSSCILAQRASNLRHMTQIRHTSVYSFLGVDSWKKTPLLPDKFRAIFSSPNARYYLWNERWSVPAQNVLKTRMVITFGPYCQSRNIYTRRVTKIRPFVQLFVSTEMWVSPLLKILKCRITVHKLQRVFFLVFSEWGWA